MFNKIHITYTLKADSGGIYPFYQIKYLYILDDSFQFYIVKVVPLKMVIFSYLICK